MKTISKLKKTKNIDGPILLPPFFGGQKSIPVIYISQTHRKKPSKPIYPKHGFWHHF